MSSILNDEGIGVVGERTVIRRSADLGLISEPLNWLEYANARNISSHIYNEAIALEIDKVTKGDFISQIQNLLVNAKSYTA